MVHALAQRVAAGELPVGPDGVEVLMGHVEKVWDRLEFRTPWAKARELDRIRMALARFLVWHHGNARQVLGVEEGFRAVLDLPDGETVRLDGYADRIELDADGRVVVVDLKTGRSKPSDKSVLTNVQLGLYQLAVDHGAAAGLLDRDADAGGAELVQLGLTTDSETATVQRQPGQADDGPERAALRDRLQRAAALLRTENFPARAGNHCRDCGFVPLCPIKSAGSVIGS
jgi:RecB family exonuclease